jgi:Sulfotransferase family
MDVSDVTVIFIGGHEHSGSTILDLYLQQHPCVVSVGEASSLDQYARPQAVRQSVPPTCHCGREWEDCPFWSRVAEESRRLGRPLETISFSDATDPDYGATCEVFFLAVARASGCATIVDSSKGLERLVTLRSRTRLKVLPVHLTRDLYSYLGSYKKRVDIGRREAIRLLWRYVSLNRGFRRQLRGGVSVSVRFEDFVADHPTILRRIYELAGLDADLAPSAPRLDILVHNLAGNRLLSGERSALNPARAQRTGELFSPFSSRVFRALSYSIDHVARSVTRLPEAPEGRTESHAECGPAGPQVGTP